MSKRKKIIIGLVITLVTVISIVLIIGEILVMKTPIERGNEYVAQENSNFATYVKPATSPSKKYQLQIVKGKNSLFDYVEFNIAKNVNGLYVEIEYSSNFIIPQSPAYYFMWDKDDKIWVYTGKDGYVVNSKRGFYYCEKDKNNKWEYYSCKDKDVNPPKELITLVESRR